MEKIIGIENMADGWFFYESDRGLSKGTLSYNFMGLRCGFLGLFILIVIGCIYLLFKALSQDYIFLSIPQIALTIFWAVLGFGTLTPKLAGFRKMFKIEIAIAKAILIAFEFFAFLYLFNMMR